MSRFGAMPGGGPLAPARYTLPRKRLPAASWSAPASPRSPGTSLPRQGAPRPRRYLPTTLPCSHGAAGERLAGWHDRPRSFGRGGLDRRGETPRRGRSRRVGAPRLASSFLTPTTPPHQRGVLTHWPHEVASTLDPRTPTSSV